MTAEEPEQEPQAPPLRPFSRIHPDLFAGLTPDQTRTIDLALSAGRLEGDHYTRQDVADLIAAATGRLSVDEYKKSLM